MIIDLTHTLSNEIPVCPGMPEPAFKESNTFEKDGFTEIYMCPWTFGRKMKISTPEFNEILAVLRF